MLDNEPTGGPEAGVTPAPMPPIPQHRAVPGRVRTRSRAAAAEAATGDSPQATTPDTEAPEAARGARRSGVAADRRATPPRPPTDQAERPIRAALTSPLAARTRADQRRYPAARRSTEPGAGRADGRQRSVGRGGRTGQPTRRSRRRPAVR